MSAPVRLIIEGERTVRLPCGQVTQYRTPLLAARGVLIAQGVAPETRFEAWWRGAAHPALTGSVGGAAKLDVEESDRDGLRLRPWRPHPGADMPRGAGGKRKKGGCPDAPAILGAETPEDAPMEAFA